MKQINKKIMLSLASTGVIITPLVASISCSSPFARGDKDGIKSSLDFINYEDYMALKDGDDDTPKTKELVERFFNYTEFGDLPELGQAIIDRKIAAGVGSDYYNATLAGKGLIQKVDFSRVFGITRNHASWSSILQNEIYTPETWKIMNSFKLKKLDKNGNPIIVNGKEVNDLDGDGKEDHLWEYMIPYFAQNKVVAFNPFKVTETSANKTALDILKAKDQNAIDGLFTNKTYKGILTKLHTLGFNNLVINDYMRDNLMIGAENTTTGLTGKIPSYATATQQIDAFNNTISSSGLNVKAYKTSGTDVANSLLTHSGDISSAVDADVTMAYNGDVLYSHYGADIDEDHAESDGEEIRYVVPSHPTFLLDGIVIPKYINKNSMDDFRLYNMLNGMYGEALTPSTIDGYDGEFNELYKNFDYVNYTPAYKHLHKYVEDNYFKGDTGEPDDNYGKGMIMTTQNATNLINDDSITQPISDNLLIRITNYYENHKLK